MMQYIIEQNEKINTYNKLREKHGITSSVNEDFINKYIEDCNDLSKNVQTDYDNITYGNHLSTYKKYSNTVNNLSYRANLISDYLKTNRNNIDRKTYNSLMSYVNNGKKSFTATQQSFANAKKYYSQWETEEDYNDYLKAQEERKKML